MGSAANGNYLGMLELLAQYDDFQKHANLGSGLTNYLSSTIFMCSQLVQLMGKRALDEIVSRIKRPGTIQLRLIPRQTRGTWIS